MKLKLAFIITSVEKGSMILSILWLTGGPDLKFLSFIAYPTTVFFLLWRWRETLWKLIQEKFFWLFTGFLFISTIWSSDFGASLYMNLKLIGTLLIGLSLGTRYSLKEQLQILAWAFGIAAVLSLFYALALPAKGITVEGTRAGSWQGIYAQKNALGRTMTFSTMVFLLQALICNQYRWLAWLGLILSFALVILSNSVTAIMILLTLLALLPLYKALRWSYSWIIPCFSIIIFLIGSLSVLATSQLDTIFGAFGKDTTLSGRIPLWQAVFDKIWEHLWFGYGYGGFWTGWHGEASEIWRTETWEPPSSHNGLLDIWLSVGIIGVILAILAFLTILLRSLSCLRSTKSLAGIWPLWYLTLLVLSNLTESTMDSRSIIWAFYMAIAISTHPKVINRNYVPRNYLKPILNNK